MATYTGQTITGASITFSADDTYVNCTIWGVGNADGSLNMNGGSFSSSYANGLYLIASNGAKIRGCSGYFSGYLDDGTVEVSGTWFNTVGYLQMANPLSSRKFLGGVFLPGSPPYTPIAIPGSPFRRREYVMNTEAFTGTTKLHDGKHQFTYVFKMNEAPLPKVTVAGLPVGTASTLEIYRDGNPTRLSFISGSTGTLTLTLPVGENYQSTWHSLVVISPTISGFTFVFSS